MREIKFRLWNKNKKVFYLFELDALLRSAFGQPTMVDGGAMDGITKPWMGFTGLTDKNNKEIYEGDTILCDPGWMTCPIVQRATVIFDQGMFGVLDKISNSGEMLKITGFKTVRIIGNIYENPDLLKDYNG